MIQYPNISPDLIHLGPLRVRWYGMMYLLGFLIGRQILRALCRRGFLRMHPDKVDDLLVALFVGMLVGSRALYMLVYYRPDPGDPFRWYTPFAVWQGGLAFHGAAIGMFAAMLWFARRQRIPVLNIADSVSLAAPIGLALGRIGNFINAELYGRETDVPWAMQFPIRTTEGVYWTTPRHPSQIYEAIGEGLLTLVVVLLVKRRTNTQGLVSAAFLMCYATARFIIEFYREKDDQLSYYFGWMTMGQVLSLVMFAISGWLLWYSLRKRTPIHDERARGHDPQEPEPAA
jgi:phosphatidylglycerol---prolipoprotein diacylglyceryl transferase